MDVLEELTAVAEVPQPRESNEQAEQAENNDKDFSLVVATHDEGADPKELGLLTVAEFAAQQTFKNFSAGLEPTEAMVQPNQVYTAIRAKRHPLPVVLVGDKAYLPAQAFEVWANRPARGEGGPSGATSKRTDEDLVKLAAENRKKLAKTQDRIEKLLARRDKEAKLAERYNRQMAERFGEDEAVKKVDEWIAANGDSETEENN